MTNLFTLSGLLSGWLVGPLYGANVVIAAVIVRKLWLRRTDVIPRALMATAIILTFTCTAQAFIHLADLVSGFTSPHEVHTSQDIQDTGPNKYFASVRFNITACLFVYAFNSFFNNSFIAWRVYVTWRRNLYLAALLTVVNIACLVVTLICARRIIHTPNGLTDDLIKALLTSAYILSMVTQIIGVLLIGWHTMKTPKVVNDGDKRYLSRTLFYAFVESGSLTLIMELAGLVFLYHDWSGTDWILIAVLGQISGLSSLGIILREIYKAELELANGFANVTSALVMQMPGYNLPRYSARHFTNTSDNDGGHSEGIMVAVETSRLEDSDAKPHSSWKDPGKHTLPELQLPHPCVCST
ncbi:hypothetical protein PENSPDRAFT_749679 [Peniophora sp. CONT]|nr:hypothetical protein PENSPDRAFT_749679 [Peniophora sp. CONT]